MDTLCLKPGVHTGIAPPISVVGSGSLEIRSCHVPATTSVAGRKSSSISLDKHSGPFWGFSFRHPLRFFRHDVTLAVDDTVLVEEEKEDKEENVVENDNWVLKILHVRSMWKQETGEDKGSDEINGISNEKSSSVCDDDENGCNEGCSVCENDDEKNVFDRESFSKLLRRVPLGEARLYSKLSYLGNLAYSIPQIKPGNLLRSHGLRFVTSSLEKKEQAQSDESKESSSEEAGKDEKAMPENCEDAETQLATDKDQVEKEQVQGHRISAAAAYQIAASAASLLQSQTKSMLPLIFSKLKQNEESSDGNCVEKQTLCITNEEVVSLLATTDSVTAVVAAKEEVKQAVADDLNSTHSSPCEWFACDDEQSGTRFFVIQVGTRNALV